MPPNVRISELISRWEDFRKQGREVSAEELCRDCPELLDDLQKQIDDLESKNRLLDSTQHPPSQLTPEPNLPGTVQAPVAITPTTQPVAVTPPPQPDSSGGEPSAGELLLKAGAAPVPGYQLVKRLGKGGFGEVWKAQGPGGFSVAMKFVRLAEETGPVELRSLELMKEIRHAHLLALFGAWQVEDYLIVAMELGDKTLQDRFREAAREGLPGIPYPELSEYFYEAAKGIDFLNEPRHALGARDRAGIQHRDIKPQNLLLVGGSVKVADFGLARFLEHSVTSHTGSMTPAYAPPEFFQGHTSSHSDQYSLAVTYCQLRGGRLPFTGNGAQIMAGHLTRPPDLSMVPEEERPALARALAKEPQERWPNCRAFVEGLRAGKRAGSVSDGATPQRAAGVARPESAKGVGSHQGLSSSTPKDSPLSPGGRGQGEGGSDAFTPLIVASPTVPPEKAARASEHATPKDFPSWRSKPARRGKKAAVVLCFMILVSGTVFGLWKAGLFSRGSDTKREQNETELRPDLAERPSPVSTVVKPKSELPSTDPEQVAKKTVLAQKIVAINIGLPAGSFMLRHAGDTEEWFLFKLVETPPCETDSVAVDNLLEALNAARQIKDLPLEKSDAEYGFDRPVVVVSFWVEGIKNDEQSPVEAKLKAEKPTFNLVYGKKDKDFVYVRKEVGGKKTLVLAPLDLLEKVSQWPLAFVSRSLPSFAVSDAVKLEIARDGAVYEVVKDPTVWKLKQPREAEGKLADAAAVERLLGELSGLRAQKLVADNPRDLGVFGLDKPSFQATVTLGKDDKKMIYLLGKYADEAKSGLYAKQGGRDLVFVVDPAIKASLEGINRLATFPMDSELLAQGNAHLEKKEYDRAVAVFSEALANNPNNVQALNGRGQAYLNKEEDSFQNFAIADFERGINLVPRNAELYRNRAQAQRKLQDLDGVIESCSQAITIKGDDVEAYVTRAYAFLGKFEYEKAFADCDQALKIDPKFSKAYFAKATLFSDLKDYDRAIFECDKALEADPKCADGHFRRGLAYYQKKSYEKAITEFTVQIELDPKNSYSYQFLFWAYKNNGKIDRTGAFSALIVRFPDNAFAYAARGRAYGDKKDFERAIADFQQAVRLDPSYADPYDALTFLINQEQTDKLIAVFTEILRNNPQDARAYVGRARCYESAYKKKFDAALADYHEAIKLRPSELLYYLSRARRLLEMKEFARAHADYSEAIKIRPHAAWLYEYRGKDYYLAREDFENALRDISTAIHMIPKSARFYESRAEVYEKQGDKAKAEADRSKAKELKEYQENFLKKYNENQTSPGEKNSGNQKKELNRLIGDLDNADFKVRAAAESALLKLGKSAEPALREALKGDLSLEARLRLERILLRSSAKP